MSWDFALSRLVVIAEYLIIYIFFKNFLGQKKTNAVQYLIAVVICMIAFDIVYNYGNDAIRFLASISCIALLTFLFDGNLKMKSFSIVLLVVFIFASDMLAGWGVEWLSGVTMKDTSDSHVLGYVCAVISKLILFIIVKSTCAIRKKDNSRLPILYWIALVAIPLISGIILFGFFVSNKENAIGNSPLFFLISLGLLFINGVTFQLFESLLEKTALEMREKLMQQQIEAQIAQYKEVISEHQTTKQFRHDTKHYFELLHNLIENGNTGEALDCLRKLKEITAVDKNYIKTGNAVIDAVFNSKIRLAKDKGIKIEKGSFLVPRDISLEPIDMCVIFANAFDNAIEACERITDGDKYIKFGLIHGDNSITFKMSNPTDGKLLKQKNRFLTSKNDNEIHGIGLYNIEKTLEKYDATFWADHNTNTFELGFILPYRKEEITQTIKRAT